MALSVNNIERVFEHDGKELADPSPDMSPENVLAHYSNIYPALTTATVQGPEVKDGKAVYSFNTSIGTKG